MLAFTKQIPKKYRKLFIASGLIAWVAFVNIAIYNIVIAPQEGLTSGGLIVAILKILGTIFVVFYTLYLVNEALKDWEKD